jgi:methyl-accepting chemotaxis protein
MNFNNLKELEITKASETMDLKVISEHQSSVEGNAVLNNDYRLLSGMLMLRRHEKDYMLRRDTLYVEIRRNASDTLCYAAVKYGVNNQFSKQLVDYSKLFHEFLSIDARIGRTENEGATYHCKNNRRWLLKA